jgi:hypothetical protein
MLRLQTMFAAALLLSLLFVAACSPSPEPQVQVRLVTPPLPPTVCARKPAAQPVEADDRDKLDAVDQVIRGWALAQE